MGGTALMEILGDAGLIALIVPMVVAFLKAKAPEYVSDDNAAMSAGIVGCVLTIAANYFGLLSPELSIGAAGVTGFVTGLTATGAYAFLKKVGVKKEPLAVEAPKPTRAGRTT